jgi:hypothetical protein
MEGARAQLSKFQTPPFCQRSVAHYASCDAHAQEASSSGVCAASVGNNQQEDFTSESFRSVAIPASCTGNTQLFPASLLVPTKSICLSRAELQRLAANPRHFLSHIRRPSLLYLRRK